MLELLFFGCVKILYYGYVPDMYELHAAFFHQFVGRRTLFFGIFYIMDFKIL
jgi:hypothetical protein